MKYFTVYYTISTMLGKLLMLEIEAPNLETAYEILNAEYPDLAITEIVVEDMVEVDVGW